MEQVPDLVIEKTNKILALQYAKLPGGTVKQMVNKILESIYTRQFMNKHSFSGSASRISKKLKGTTPPTLVKPGLPDGDLKAIFCKILKLSKIKICDK